jgi:hypothetical protein
MRYTATRFEQVPLEQVPLEQAPVEVVRKMVGESAKRSSFAQPLPKKRSIVKHPPIARRGVKL